VRRLSISSFSHRYGRLLLWMAVWVLLLEVFLRVPAVQSRLAQFEHETFWYSPYVPARIRLIEDNPNADIWFIGASPVMQGANPAGIDPLFRDEAETERHSLNLGLPGMLDTSYLENYVTEVFLPINQPDVAVLGVFPYIFAYSTHDYDALGGVEVKTRNNSGQWDQQVGHWLSQNLAMYRFIQTLNYAFFQIQGERVQADTTGFIPSDGSILDNSPFLRVIEASGNGNTRLEMNLTLVKHLRDTLAARDIRLMILNFPLHDILIENYPGGSGRFDEYLARMTAFSQDEQIPFCDLHRPFEAEYGDVSDAYFQDYYHLNTRGAAAVAPMIAAFLAQNIDTTPSLLNSCSVFGG
jgi:hypothetical protein